MTTMVSLMGTFVNWLPWRQERGQSFVGCRLARTADVADYVAAVGSWMSPLRGEYLLRLVMWLRERERESEREQERERERVRERERREREKMRNRFEEQYKCTIQCHNYESDTLDIRTYTVK